MICLYRISISFFYFSHYIFPAFTSLAAASSAKETEADRQRERANRIGWRRRRFDNML